MDNMNIASRIGLRCKRIRESKGWSMQYLGDKVGTGAANISKMEKNGINSIEWITAISEALGQDLLKDEIDEEGIIGEIGKEILIKLIENKGYLLYSDVVSDMHGMSEDRVSNEIFKLTRIGMCVREQYKDFYNKQKDMIFITAKGLITCCNQITNPLIEARITPMIPNVTTYENLLSEDPIEDKISECYQDWIDNHTLEKIIRNLPYTETLYRMEFITWLKKNYTHGIDKFETSDEVDGLIPSKEFYHDVLYRMALDIDNDELLMKFSSEYFSTTVDPYEEDDSEYFEFDRIEKKLGIPDPFEKPIGRYHVDKMFADEFEIAPIQNHKSDIDLSILSKKERELYDRYSREIIAEFEDEEFRNMSAKERFQKRVDKMKAKGVESMYPADWFSEDEILEFVKTNFKKASNTDEEHVDSQIAKIIELSSDVLKYYGLTGLNSGAIPDCVKSYIKDIYNI